LNLILDGLPETVDIAGNKVEIETSFRTGIIFEEMLSDPELSDEDKLLTMLELYYPGIVFDETTIREAIEKIFWFYRCGSEPRQTAGGDEGGETVFSYEYDADYIYAGFMSAYRIDLAKETLHWWQFRALFRSLPEDTQMMKIIGYRSMKISPKLSKEQKEHYKRMKRMYALPGRYEQTKAESDLTEILMKGGNPSALLNVEGDSKQWQTEH
jgi:putative phage gp15 protein